MKNSSNQKDLEEIISLYNAKQFAEAENKIKKLLEVEYDNPVLIHTLGVILVGQKKIQEAIKFYKKAIDIKPFPETYHNLAVVLGEQGHLEKSIVYFKKALSIKPNYAEAHRQLSNIIKYRELDSHIIQMEKYILDPKIDDDKKMHLAFGLGKAHDDLKNFNLAFKYYLKGNRLKRKKIKYSSSADIELFKNLKKAFNKKLYKKFINAGNLEQSPIFIVGMPRSGTTLVEQIISSHPKVYGAGELHYLTYLVVKYFKKQDGENSFNNLENYNNSFFKKIGDEYIKNLKKLNHNLDFVTDKMPLNFRWIGLIKLILPKAKIIHCVREPTDNCISIFKNYFSTDVAINWGYDLEELGTFYNSYNNLMKYWKKMFHNYIYEIKYEELINNQKNETKKLLRACNLKWDDACLKFFKNKRPIHTASLQQVRQPIYKSSVNSWRNYEKNITKLLKIIS